MTVTALSDLDLTKTDDRDALADALVAAAEEHAIGALAATEGRVIGAK